MSQPDQNTSKPRSTGGSVALVVAGLELLVLGLIAHVWVGLGFRSSDIWAMPIRLMVEVGPVYVVVTGTVLTIAGFVVSRFPRGVSQERTPPAWTSVSAALFVIGLLVLVPSGLCSALVIAGSGGRAFIFALIFGGVPIAIGAILVAIGLGTRRSD